MAEFLPKHFILVRQLGTLNLIREMETDELQNVQLQKRSGPGVAARSYLELIDFLGKF